MTKRAKCCECGQPTRGKEIEDAPLCDHCYPPAKAAYDRGMQDGIAQVMGQAANRGDGTN